MRICRSCGEQKQDTDFYAGRDPRCKVCLLAKKKRVYGARKAGLLRTTPVDAAICPDCCIEKPASEFGVDHARPSGQKLYCKPCARARTRNSRYQITDVEHGRIVQAQAGCCAICEQPSKLVVDHDHADGQVRGLLCDPCNVGLGRFDDDPDRLLAAAAYLLKNVNLLKLETE